MASAIVPGIYDPTLADEDLRVSTERAHELVRRLAREEGLLAGISSGAALAAMLDVARRLDRGVPAVIVTIFPDGAEKYLSDRSGRPGQMTSHRLVVSPAVDDAIRRHGEETYPHECCGALVGHGGRVTATVPLPNTTEEGPRRRFLVRPSDYRMAEERATRVERRAARVLSFASGSPRAAVAVRSGSRMADVCVRHRGGRRRAGRRHDRVVAERRSIEFRRGRTASWRRKF